MSERKTNVKKAGKKSKASKSKDGANQNRMAVAVARSRESPSAILNLHDIVFDKLFEYLSLEDLYSIGMTCKRLNRLAGLYFKKNFRNVVIQYKNNGIRTYGDRKSIDLIGFIKYLQTIRIDGNDRKSFDFVESNCISIEKVIIHNALNGAWMDIFKNTMANVKYVELYNSNNNHEPCKDLFNLFTKMKCLRLNVTPLSVDWFRQEFPQLECVELLYENSLALKKFLEINPSIRFLKIKSKFLIKYGDSLKTLNRKLDELCIENWDSIRLDSFNALLVDLHQREFYKRLNMELLHVNQISANLLSNLPVEKIGFATMDKNIVWPLMVNLKQLKFSPNENSGLEALIKSAVNLERIEIWRATFDDIQMMMRSLPNLKEIVVNDHCFEYNKALDISALNQTREKLNGASKVHIYHIESVYLETKWMIGQRKFNLVEIRRIESLPLEPKLMSSDEN